MRKLRKFIVTSSTDNRLSIREMQALSGGSRNFEIYSCTCYVTMPNGGVNKKNVNVVADSQSAAENGVLGNQCKEYTSAYCQFLSHINGTH